MNVIELIGQHLTSYKWSRNELKAHKLRRDALPFEIAMARKELARMERTLSQMVKVENLEELSKERAALEKTLPKKKKGEEYLEELAETVEKVKALKESIKAGILYATLEGKIADKKAEIEARKAELSGLMQTAKAERKELFFLEGKIAEAEECLALVSTADKWQDKVMALAKACEKATKKTGNVGCGSCQYYSQRLGGCTIMKEWSSRPSHWKVDRMEAVLWQA